MSDESMHRTLAAQAAAIWPQEIELIRAYALRDEIEIFDLGCGPGEISTRLLDAFPKSTLVGMDIEDDHVAAATKRSASYGDRAVFRKGDALATQIPDNSYDFSVCRHLLQAVPEAQLVLKELCRVTRPHGRIHLLAEDYGMIYFHPTRLDTDEFWRKGPMKFADEIGTDLRSGRKIYSMLHALGVDELSVNYVKVDTVQVARETFAAIWCAWRDGYAKVIAEHTDYSLEEVMDHWADMLACIRNPAGYGLWSVPVVSGLVPG
jgi:ubiquinone/menaquinone biosynthesis C-methylase UbiE